KFILRFGKANDSEVAIRALRSLRQTGSVSRYTADFESLRIRVEGLNDSVAKALYIDGLKPDIRTLVLGNHSTIDASVDEIVALAEQIDSAPSHSRSVRSVPYHSNNRQMYHPRPTPTVDPMAMELDSIRVQPRSGSHSRYQTPYRSKEAQRKFDFEHNLCLYCHGPGHRINECPRKSGKARTQ
ncbi:hypothetical protein BGW41_008321, partial [Actinomortierella wolfii]